MALADIMKEVFFLRQVWRFMLSNVGTPCIPVFDNIQGAVHLAQNSTTNSQLEAHRRATPHPKGTSVGNIYISVIHIGSTFQHADFLAKPIAQDAFEFHHNFAMNLLRLLCCDSGFRITLKL